MIRRNPGDIYELGLIYRIDISDDRFITIDMTLTAPGCPVAGGNAGLGGDRCSECARRFRVPGDHDTLIRHGTRAACRMRRASLSTCGEQVGRLGA